MTDQEPELVDVTEAVADSSLPPEEPAAAEDHAADEETVEQAEQAVHEDLGRIAAERDEFRALAQRVQADFENYKKRMIRQQTDHLERAAQGLVDKLLPVLDAFDLAVAHGEGVEQLRSSLLSVLEKEGLQRIDPAGAPFDPTEHDAVAHEAGDGDGQLVAEVMRPGYRWKGRVIRPAMVKVKG